VRALRAGLRARLIRFRRELLVVAWSIRDPRTPAHLRVAGLALLLYLASPVDLIPLTVPVAGLVDDLLLVPWGLGRVAARLPVPVRGDAEARADRFIRRWVARPLVFLALLLLVLGLLWGLLLWLVWRAVS
jgi:uncharacterized membrane protein YkvA (DUF1232 family)